MRKSKQYKQGKQTSPAISHAATQPKNAGRLPQTGDQSATGLLGLATACAASLFGLAGTKRKKD